MGISMMATKVVIEGCAFFVGLDSGNLFIADACDKQAFAIMGSTSATPQEPDQTGSFMGPVGPKIHYLEPNRPNHPSCRPIACVGGNCALGNPCIEMHTVDSVFDYIKFHTFSPHQLGN
jgi:hypothetical protein